MRSHCATSQTTTVCISRLENLKSWTIYFTIFHVRSGKCMLPLRSKSYVHSPYTKLYMRTILPEVYMKENCFSVCWTNVGREWRLWCFEIVVPYSLVDGYQYFGATCGLHIQSWWQKQEVYLKSSLRCTKLHGIAFQVLNCSLSLSWCYTSCPVVKLRVFGSRCWGVYLDVQGNKQEEKDGENMCRRDCAV